jgi:hypothetical protein
MVETIPSKPLVVHNRETDYPFLIVPVEQLTEVRSILDAHDLIYWPSKYYISINHTPFNCHLHFARGTDGRKVQAVLDAR